MVWRATRNDLTRTRAFWLLCLAVCLSMLVFSGRAWAEEAPAEDGQDETADIELVLDDVSAPTPEAQDEAETPSESLDVANSDEEPIAADYESDTDGAEASLPDTEDQSQPVLLTQGSDSAMQDNGIPALRLSIDPDEYQKMIDSPFHEYRAVGATISLDVPDGYTGEFSTSELPDLADLSLEYIRGRGNTTWQDPKRPFKFKLDKKANLLGMGNGKHWVLLANSYDETLLRNRLTSYLGRQLGLDYTPKMEPVDLYVNDEYKGSYVLAPQVRIDDISVAIDELGPDDTSEPEVSGGYLLGLKPYPSDPYINTFTTSRGVEFLVDDPDFSEMGDEDANALQAQRAYITAYLQSVEDAIFADGMEDEDGVPYDDFIDLPSAAAYWWVQELSMNSDAFITTSTYLYKERDGKLYWGPLWDFDIAYEGTEVTQEDYESLTITNRMKWLDHMCENDTDYQELLRDTWRDLDAILDDIVAEGGVLDQYAAEVKESWMANQRLWSDYPMSDEEAERHFEEQLEGLRSFLRNRQAGINASIESGFGDRCVTVRFIVGDTVVKTVEVRRHGQLDVYDYPPDPKREGYYFLEWQCEGEADSVEYRNFDEDCDVYAVFKPDEEITRPQGLFFTFDDVWVDTDTTIMSSDVVIVPSDAIDRRLTWTSSDPSVADILPTGFLKVKSVGETVFTCTSSNGLTASFTLHVYDPKETKAHDLEGFELESDRLELKVGQYGQVKVSVFPQPVRYAFLIFQSSDESIASPSPYTGVIEGIAPGTCTITVRDVFGKMERQYTVVVTDDVEPDPDLDPDPEPQPDPEPVDPSTVTYLCTSGDNGTWSKGSGDPLGFKFERSENNHLTFIHFTGVLVDDKPVDESNYTAKEGSLVLELKPSFLEGLSAGKHTVTALFDDGSAQAAFVVSSKEDGSEAEPSGKEPDTDEVRPTSGTTSASTRIPNTGDDSAIGSTVALCVCGLVSLAAGVQVRRRG